MHLTSLCPACQSVNLDLQLTSFAPFISHLIMNYAPQKRSTGGGEPLLPVLLVNKATCKDCGFVFSEARPDTDDMKRIYKDYRGDRYSYLRNLYEPGYAEINPHIGHHVSEKNNRAIAVVNFLSDVVDLSDRKRILDYGGDKGQHIPAVISGDRFVYDVSGVETEPDVTRLTQIENQKFDFIMCCNVLEHLSYPAATVRKLRNVCDEDGVLFIDVPMEFKANGRMRDSFHEHINFFTIPALRKCVELSGFKVLKTEIVSLDFGWTQSSALYLAARSV